MKTCSPIGLKCPTCGTRLMYVDMTVHADDAVVRRRKCVNSHVVVTQEFLSTNEIYNKAIRNRRKGVTLE